MQDMAALTARKRKCYPRQHVWGWIGCRGEDEAAYEVRLKSMRTEFRLQPFCVVVVKTTTGETPTPPCTT